MGFVFQGRRSAELELASSSLESLSLAFQEILPGQGINSSPALPKLSDLRYACENNFSSLFTELPALRSLSFVGSLSECNYKVR